MKNRKRVNDFVANMGTKYKRLCPSTWWDEEAWKKCWKKAKRNWRACIRGWIERTRPVWQ